MNPMRALACAAAFALLGCGGPARTSPPAGPEPSTMSDAEMEKLFRARQDSANMRFSEADVRFMTGMISHHGQALVMAGLAPSHDAGPSVQTLCARIINAQKDEIALMQRWLSDRGQPVPEVHVDGTSMMVHGAGGMLRMPGMLTEEQMQQLDRARGREFDRLFLTFMIQHHRGAVTMVHELFASDNAAQGDLTFKIASDIQADQTTEIARMEKMLAAMAVGGN